jgi:hypothetical protein
MVEQADKYGEQGDKIQVFYLAKKAALHIISVITNNKTLVDVAFKSVEVITILPIAVKRSNAEY